MLTKLLWLFYRVFDYRISVILRSLFIALCFIFVVCTFCGKDIISIGRQSWRCKRKLNTGSGYNGVDSTLQKQITPDSMPVITNSDKNVKCTCGEQCKGLKGLQAHQRSCRLIQGIHENLITYLEEGIYEDEIDSASGEIGEITCQPLFSIHFNEENEGIQSGVKLPKSSQQWSVANDFFKAKSSNRPISSMGLNETIKELNCIIYNYFGETCRTVDNAHNRQLSVKYKDKNSKDLKRILKALKRSGGDIEEIKFISRKLREMLRNGNSGDSGLSCSNEGVLAPSSPSLAPPLYSSALS